MYTTTGADSTENSTAGYEDGIVSWNAILTAFEVVTVILLAVALYVLTSIVVYGTNTGRWKKSAGASSLNSGMIYVTFAIATTTVVLEIAWNVVMYQVPRMGGGFEWCEVFCDTTAVMNGLAGYTAYLFIWARQRLIYTHPYVKERIDKCMDCSSLVLVVPYTLIYIGLLCLYMIPPSYQYSSNGCLQVQKVHEGYLALIFSLGATQIILTLFSIYPVARVRFQPDESASNDVDSGPESGNRANAVMRGCQLVFTGGVDSVTSPIQRNTRATMIFVIIMVLSDVVLLSVEKTLPGTTPVALRSIFYDICAIVRVFCMVATFGFAGRILTFFCPKFEKESSREPAVPLAIAKIQV